MKPNVHQTKRLILPFFCAVACLAYVAPAAHARYSDGMNLYEYVRSTPCGKVDPEGTKPPELKTIAEWLEWGQDKRKVIQETKNGGADWTTQVAGRLKASLCNDQCINKKAGDQSKCSLAADALATAYVESYFRYAYSNISYAYLRAQNEKDPKIPNFWNETGYDPTNVHAGGMCYHWMYNTWDAVKGLVETASSANTQPTTKCFIGQTAASMEVGTGSIKIRTNYVVIRGCNTSKEFSDTCSVRLDPWLEGLPKAYLPEKHQIPGDLKPLVWDWITDTTVPTKSPASYGNNPITYLSVFGRYNGLNGIEALVFGREGDMNVWELVTPGTTP